MSLSELDLSTPEALAALVGDCRADHVFALDVISNPHRAFD